MQSPETALVLENWFPTTSGVRIRRGRAKRATLQGSPVVSMWEYVGSTTRKRFAADSTRIYDITSVADPNAAVTATISSRTSGYYSTPQISTVGGNFQYCFNGTDKPLLYDGTTFTAIDGASTPAITGVTTTTLSQGWVYANRLFMVQKDTMNAWYLPVDSVGGTALVVSLKGVFRKGGALMYGATWGASTGSGIDQKCVFVSTNGQAAIYSGPDPSDATKWALQGVYDITRPLGPKAIMEAGGDLMIAVDDGIIPISSAVSKDTAALSLDAVTAAIESEWRREAVARTGLPFEILKWPANAMMVVSLPPTFTGLEDCCFVANLKTGAWCKFTNWQTRCMALFSDRGFFGANDGCVYEMEVGGKDGAALYTANYVGGFDHFSAPGVTKTVTQARAVFRTASPLIPKISCSTNYSPTLPSAPASPADYVAPVWDSALWDSAVWDTSSSPTQSTVTPWIGIGATGFSIAPQVQATFLTTPEPKVEFLAFDIAYEAGGIIV